MEHYLAVKEDKILRLVGKMDDVMSFQTQKNDDVLQKVESAGNTGMAASGQQDEERVTPWQVQCQDILRDMAEKIVTKSASLRK